MSWLIPFTTPAVPVPFALCLIEPQGYWKVGHIFETNYVEGRTGIDSRSPAHEAFRLKITYDFLMDEVQAGEFRAAIRGIGETRLALPLWMDKLPTADWSAERIYASQYWFSYTGENVAINAATYATAAGLVVGRVEKLPEIKPAGGKACEVRLTLIEDSPWEMRISANPYGPDEFDFVVDWPSISEQMQRQLRTEQIGAGREAAVRGQEGATKRGQRGRIAVFDRNEIRHLLGFFEARKGAFEAFPAPTWYHPNVGSENLNYRFEDVLTLEYEGSHFAEARVKLVEEIELIDGELPQEQPGRTWLYRFQFENGTPRYWTSYEKPLEFDSNTFEPRKLEHHSFTQTLKPEGDDVEILADNFEGNPMRALVFLELERKLFLTIWECDPASPEDAVEIFDGEVLNARAMGRGLVGRAATLGGALRKMIPTFQMQSTCNYVLGQPDPLCGKVFASMEHNGTVDAIDGNVVEITTGSSDAADFFALGWAIVGSGDSAEYRAIVRSEPISGGQRLTFHKALKQTGALAVTFYPGCDSQFSTCGTKFSNAANFGGFPYVPSFIESVASPFTQKLGK